MPSLPVGSLPAEEWVAFGKVTKAMEKVDLEARKVRNARRLYQDERPPEVESACSESARALLRLSKERAAGIEEENRRARERMVTETFQDEGDAMAGVAEETASQLRSASSTLDAARDQ